MLPLRVATRLQAASASRRVLNNSSLTPRSSLITAQWTRQRSFRPKSAAPIKSSTGSKQAREQERTSSQETGEFNPDATPEVNTIPNSQPGPAATTSQAVAAKSSSSAQTAEFNAYADPTVSTTPEQQPGPSPFTASSSTPQTEATTETPSFPDDSSTSQQPRSDGQPDPLTGPSVSPSGEDAAEGTQQTPRQPLPDLRYGIPSTFAQEFMKQSATQKSTTEDRSHQDPNNVTEDPRGPEPGAGSGRDGPELPRSAYETSIDKRRNRLANYMYLFFAIAGTSGAVYLGRNWEIEEEERMHPEAPSGWSPGLVWNRITARMSGQMGYYTEPTFPKLLPTMDPTPPYTLVLSLEDLMIHSEWSREHGWRTAKRPGLDYFLRYLSQYYELVLWTSLPLAYADQIVRKLDPYHIIMWPLFREATLYDKGKHVKDLSYLNRPLDKVIIMDASADSVKNQPENAIVLKPWTGDAQDKELVSFIPFLEYIATMGITDVRAALKSFDGKHIPTEYARREAALREQFERDFASQSKKKPRVSGLGFLNSALGMKSQGGTLTMDGQTSVAEGLAEGKMLSDQIRERGMKQYQALEKEIRENGEKWLKEEAEMEKKAQAEQAQSAKSWATGWFGSSSPPPPPTSAPTGSA